MSTALKEITLHQIHGSLFPSPYRLLVHSLCGTFSTTPSNCNSKRIPLLPSLLFPAPVCAILSTYETESQPPPPPSLFFPKSVFHFVFFSKGLCLKLDAKKNVQKMSYFLFIKTQTVSPPTTTSYITERLLLLKYCIRFLCRCLRM